MKTAITNSNFLFLFMAMFFSVSLYSQTTELYIGNTSNSFVIKANETVSVAGLTLSPTADLDLTNNQITKTNTVTNAATQTYVPLVYKFSSNTNAFTGTISISYAGITFGTETNYKFHYHDGTRWNRDASSTVNTGTDVVTSSALSSVVLNELTISDITTTLPVTWLSFTAEKQGAGALLKWSTATEQNTKDFEVQHSTNATSWTALGTVDAAGNSNTVRSYSFTHATPFKGNIYNYYRILQRDVDGKSSYSKIASLIYDEPGADVIVYPNPAKESLTIYLAETQEVRLINVAGATIWKGTLTAGRNQLNLTRFAKGIYWVITESVKKQIVIQ
jgi:hypothetical protein